MIYMENNNEGTVSFDAGDNPKFRESVAGKTLGIPTAEEYLKKHEGYFTPDDLIEFTKLHVKAALEAAYNNAELREFTKEDSKNDNYICHTSNDMGDSYVLDKDSIINSYPDSLIK